MRVLVPVSGGIDSGYLLYKAKKEGHEVVPIIFDDCCECQESRSAYALCAYYDLAPTTLRILRLDQIVVKPEVTGGNSQAEALQHVSYFSGYKVLMYTAVLAYGSAHNIDEIWWGTSGWNDHFTDELPESAQEFRALYSKLYPELSTPSFEFPIYHYTKTQVVLNCLDAGFPLHLTWSCFNDETSTPCGVCLGCKERDKALELAHTIQSYKHPEVNY